ncbi:MAG: hypothetical protein P4L55_17755, partial [Syntrophobacteraceae bacterium]|nr:hypothetical protein [Syntrophobacteraceae bacterium]
MSFLLLLAALLLLVAIWAALVTYSFFWYENGWKARSSPEGRGLSAMVLRGMLSSFASVAFIILTYPLGCLRGPEKLPASGPVIILTHGL